MISRVSRNKFLTCFIVIILCACQEEHEELELTGKMNIPYVNECNESVKAVKNYYQSQDNQKTSRIDFNVLKFDQMSLANFGLDGLLTIKVFGDLKLQPGISIDHYILGIADSIAMECMPIDGISFQDSILQDKINRIKSTYGSKRVLTVFEGGLVSLYYNKNKDRAYYR